VLALVDGVRELGDGGHAGRARDGSKPVLPVKLSHRLVDDVLLYLAEVADVADDLR
jgi:hypothetical protein